MCVCVCVCVTFLQEGDGEGSSTQLEGGQSGFVLIQQLQEEVELTAALHIDQRLIVVLVGVRLKEEGEGGWKSEVKAVIFNQ